MHNQNATFEGDIPLTGFDLDGYGSLKPGSVLSMIQRSGEMHLRTTAYSLEELAKENLAWVLVSVTAQIGKVPVNCFDLHLKTWPLPPTPPIFRRDMTLCDGEGNAVVSAAIFSAVIDLEKRVIARQFSIKEDVPTLNLHAVEGAVSRLTVPSGVHLEIEEIRRVHNSHIDMLGHVNNSRYGDYAYDMLSVDEVMRGVERLHIDFQSELCLGDTFSLSRSHEKNGRIYFTGSGAGFSRPIFRAMFKLGPKADGLSACPTESCGAAR